MNKTNAITTRVIADRLLAEWRLKLALLLALNAWVYLPYYYLQRNHFFPAITMPASPLDRWIPFWSGAVWIYFSVYLLMPIGPFLMNQRKQLLRYAAGIALIGAIADVVFVFWPTVCPRPDPSEANAVYQTLIAIDTPFHAFPSLHAAFAVYSALCAIQVLREVNGKRLWRAVPWIWAFLILAATLLTKQHVVADIVAGSGLGFGGYFLAFREWNFRRKPESVAPTFTTKTARNQSTPT